MLHGWIAVRIMKMLLPPASLTVSVDVGAVTARQTQ
jgi:hypothetical protein